MKGLLLLLNGLLSIAFRTTLFVAFPITLPILALIHYWTMNAKLREMEYHAELTAEEKTELGI